MSKADLNRIAEVLLSVPMECSNTSRAISPAWCEMDWRQAGSAVQAAVRRLHEMWCRRMVRPIPHHDAPVVEDKGPKCGWDCSHGSQSEQGLSAMLLHVHSRHQLPVWCCFSPARVDAWPSD